MEYRSLKTNNGDSSKSIGRPSSSLHAQTASLVVELMNAATSFHKLHLSVTGEGSFAQHKALNEIYDNLPKLADTIVLTLLAVPVICSPSAIRVLNLASKSVSE